jgi:Zn finger protein HypA/HybF involved in hydrogenase expression
MRTLVREVAARAVSAGAVKVSSVRIRLGVNAGIDPERLREQFTIAAMGSVAEGALLEIGVVSDVPGGEGNGVFIESLEILD